MCKHLLVWLTCYSAVSQKELPLFGPQLGLQHAGLADSTKGSEMLQISEAIVLTHLKRLSLCSIKGCCLVQVCGMLHCCTSWLWFHPPELCGQMNSKHVQRGPVRPPETSSQTFFALVLIWVLDHIEASTLNLFLAAVCTSDSWLSQLNSNPLFCPQ